MNHKRADESFGEYICRVRRLYGLTQTQLADQIGVGRAMVCHYETGTRNPSVHAALGLVSVLDLDPDAVPPDGRGKVKPPELLPSAPGGVVLLPWR